MRTWICAISLILLPPACMGLRASGPKQAEKRLHILHTTDIHGWVMGHPHEPPYDADLGDLVSLVEHMNATAQRAGDGFMVFDTGDVIEGTGLSDATPTHGKYILEALTHVPYAALTIGNHDVGHNDTLSLIRSKFAPHRNGRYVTSNVMWRQTGTPLGERYYTTVSAGNGVTATVLGYLFDFNYAAENVEVVPVGTSLQEAYFAEAMGAANYSDVIVVLMHVAPSQSECTMIYTAIRHHQPTKPLVLLTGHSHEIAYQQLDANAYLLESDHYLYHVGYLDIHLVGGAIASVSHSMVDGSRAAFADLAGLPKNKFSTPSGLRLKRKLHAVYSRLGLGRVLGCAHSTYGIGVADSDPASLHVLFIEHVVVEQLFAKQPTPNTPVYVGSRYFLRDNLYKGVIRADDLYCIMPFDDTFRLLPALSGAHLIGLMTSLNVSSPDGYVERGVTDSIPRFKHPFNGQRAPIRLKNGDNLNAWGDILRDIRRPVGRPDYPRWLVSISLDEIDPTATYSLVGNSYDAKTFNTTLERLYPNTYAFGGYDGVPTTRKALGGFIGAHFPLVNNTCKV